MGLLNHYKWGKMPIEHIFSFGDGWSVIAVLALSAFTNVATGFRTDLRWCDVKVQIGLGFFGLSLGFMLISGVMAQGVGESRRNKLAKENNVDLAIESVVGDTRTKLERRAFWSLVLFILGIIFWLIFKDMVL